MAGLPRVYVPVRLSASSVAWLDKMALEAGQTRSDAIRAALKVAAAHPGELQRALGSQA